MTSKQVEQQKTFFKSYQQAINFNKNIIISGLVAFFTGALVAHLYSEYDKSSGLANSTVTLASEYAIYIPAFGLLHYSDNRRNYTDVRTGKRDGKKIRADMKKLFATFSLSETVFSLTKLGVQFQLLQMNMEAYVSAMIASIVAWSVFFVLVNYVARITNLFAGKD